MPWSGVEPHDRVDPGEHAVHLEGDSEASWLGAAVEPAPCHGPQCRVHGLRPVRESSAPVARQAPGTISPPEIQQKLSERALHEQLIDYDMRRPREES